MSYVILTIKHKWFVFLAGLRFGVSWWRLITHDWTKFLPSELPHYQRQFFGDKGDAEGFILCWIRHQNRHDHHWEWWIPRTGHNRCEPPYPDNIPVPMCEGAVREMISDWYGASRAYEGRWPKHGKWGWFDKNFDRIRVHPDTRKMILNILCDDAGRNE